MYCCKCGAEIYLRSKYCHNCGDTLPESAPDLESSFSHGAEVATNKESAPRRQPISPQPSCHKCGSYLRLNSWDFGLGKVALSRRSWSETAISAALSAVSVPLTGYGMLRLPGKRTTFGVLRLRLILCDSCVRNREGYECHPLWAEAHRLGFTEFFCSADLKKLAPVHRA